MNESGLPPVPRKNPGTGFSIAALVLGILAILIARVPIINIISIIFGILGIVLAAIGRKKSIAAGMPDGLGTAGLVLSILGLCLGSILYVSCTLCVSCTACHACNASAVAE